MATSLGGLSADDSTRVVELAADLARNGRTDELLEFLEHGLPVDLADAQGNTLLMLAAYHGHAETVVALIGCGADVNLRNDRDQTPVAGALFKGEKQVVRALVTAGADLDSGTPTARQAAEMFGTQALLEP